MCIYINTYIYIYRYTYIYIYMCVCVCVYMYICAWEYQCLVAALRPQDTGTLVYNWRCAIIGWYGGGNRDSL